MPRWFPKVLVVLFAANVAGIIFTLAVMFWWPLTVYVWHYWMG